MLMVKPTASDKRRSLSASCLKAVDERRLRRAVYASPCSNNSDEADDGSLVERCLMGDRTAFDLLVLRYQDRIHRFVSWSIGNDDAAYASQDVFVEAFRSLGTWRRHSTFRTWLYGIARNICRHRVRQRSADQRNYSERDVDDFPDSASGPLQHLSGTDQRVELAEAIARLPPDQRITLMLRAWEGLSYDEIAVATNVPKGTVRSRLHNARRAIAHAIAETEDD